MKKVYYDIDIRKKQLLQARFQNVTTAQETTMAESLTNAHVGLVVFNQSGVGFLLLTQVY